MPSCVCAKYPAFCLFFVFFRTLFVESPFTRAHLIFLRLLNSCIHRNTLQSLTQSRDPLLRSYKTTKGTNPTWLSNPTFPFSLTLILAAPTSGICRGLMLGMRSVFFLPFPSHTLLASLLIFLFRHYSCSFCGFLTGWYRK